MVADRNSAFGVIKKDYKRAGLVMVRCRLFSKDLEEIHATSAAWIEIIKETKKYNFIFLFLQSAKDSRRMRLEIHDEGTNVRK